MSYDLYLEADLGGEDPVEVFWVNYTSNCAPMWRSAMPSTDGLAGFHGMKAADTVPVLDGGIAAMRADMDAFRRMNPKNGWGDADSTLDLLLALREAAASMPLATWSVSR